MAELSVRLISPLTTPTILPPTGSVEKAQPIRTMTIIVESGGRDGGGAGERHSEEVNEEEGEKEENGVEEGEEQEEVSDS